MDKKAQQKYIQRRKWNNYLILAVIVFITLINAPAVIKEYLLADEGNNATAFLLNPSKDVIKLRLIDLQQDKDWHLTNVDGSWRSNITANISLDELVQRWQELEGTKIDKATLDLLEPNLGSYAELTVWYKGIAQAQQSKIYPLENFWLLNNWDNQWIAITTSSGYLMPFEL